MAEGGQGARKESTAEARRRNEDTIMNEQERSEFERLKQRQARLVANATVWC